MNELTLDTVVNLNCKVIIMNKDRESMKVTFENGDKVMAYLEEICKVEVKERNQGKINRNKSKDGYCKE